MKDTPSVKRKVQSPPNLGILSLPIIKQAVKSVIAIRRKHNGTSKNKDT